MARGMSRAEESEGSERNAARPGKLLLRTPSRGLRAQLFSLTCGVPLAQREFDEFSGAGVHRSIAFLAHLQIGIDRRDLRLEVAKDHVIELDSQAMIGVDPLQ